MEKQTAFGVASAEIAFPGFKVFAELPTYLGWLQLCCILTGTLPALGQVCYVRSRKTRPCCRQRKVRGKNDADKSWKFPNRLLLCQKLLNNFHPEFLPHDSFWVKVWKKLAWVDVCYKAKVSTIINVYRNYKMYINMMKRHHLTTNSNWSKTCTILLLCSYIWSFCI